MCGKKYGGVKQEDRKALNIDDWVSPRRTWWHSLQLPRPKDGRATPHDCWLADGRYCAAAAEENSRKRDETRLSCVVGREKGVVELAE